jgi:hypothetical protein
MHFSQKQIREELEIPQQTYRYWASCIPALRTRAGKGARLTFADAVGLAFTFRLCEQYGVRIGAVAAGLDDLFRQLNSRSWLELDGTWIKLCRTTAEIMPSETTLAQVDSDAFLVECAPILRLVRERIFDMAPSAQLVLNLGPVRLRHTTEVRS